MLRVLPTGHEVVVELVVHFGLVEGELLRVVDPHQRLAQGVTVTTLAPSENQPVGRHHSDLAVVNLREKRGLHALGNAHCSTVGRSLVHVVNPVNAVEEPPVDSREIHDLAPRHRQLHHLGETPSGIVVVTCSSLRLRWGSASVPSQRRVVAAVSPQDLLLCLNELVLHVPETAAAKVQGDILRSGPGQAETPGRRSQKPPPDRAQPSKARAPPPRHRRRGGSRGHGREAGRGVAGALEA
mmetsp:Transcript_72920/g.165372  ORF Transcript_72920/g.165372 Transcript_72920/m.165372 type:complete len:240 (+) Transcript_72920:296-1015(+)